MSTLEDQISTISSKIDGIAKAEDLSPITDSISLLQGDLKTLATLVAAIAAKLPASV